MADKRDYYEVLGVKKDVSESDLKKAFLKLVKENHPDLHPGDKACEARMKEINEAYEVLSDADKRAKYDRLGFAGVDPNYGAGSPGGGFSGFGDFDLSDILSNLGFGGFNGFGGGTRNRNAPMRGQDIRVGLSISFEEAAFGCEKRIKLSRVEKCESCGGSGCAAGTTPEVCSHCRGSGQVFAQRRTAFGVMQSSQQCPMCGGSGKIIHQPCTKCGGAGVEKRQRTITVNIPAGADSNQTFALSGEGHAGENGGPAGDLLVTVSVRPHEFFIRDGNDVRYEMPVSVTQAILGSELDVPTIDGNVRFSIPEGTQPGEQFAIRGKGIPYMHSARRGDEIITVKVTIPRNLTIEQKDLVQQLDESLDGGAKRKRPKKFKL